jgi:hypothetical protein
MFDNHPYAILFAWKGATSTRTNRGGGGLPIQALHFSFFRKGPQGCYFFDDAAIWRWYAYIEVNDWYLAGGGP